MVTLSRESIVTVIVALVAIVTVAALWRRVVCWVVGRCP